VSITTPYARAWAAWHADGPPPVAWDELLTFFFHHGAVVSTDEGFMLARPCQVEMPAAALNALSPLQFTGDADCWNIWLAAGRLPFLLHLARKHPLPWVCFCRRGQDRLRRYRTTDLLARHDQAENARTTAARTAASDQHRA